MKGGLTVDAEPGTVVAFPSEMRHGAPPVSHGERFTVVTWFHRLCADPGWASIRSNR